MERFAYHIFAVSAVEQQLCAFVDNICQHKEQHGFSVASQSLFHIWKQFFLDLGQLILDHAHQLMFIGKQLVVVSDLLQEILIFVFDLLFFQALQSSQLHIEDRLRLDLG